MDLPVIGAALGNAGLAQYRGRVLEQADKAGSPASMAFLAAGGPGQ
jgi:hypothetical protein